MSLFTNGNARVTRLIIIQLGLGQLVIVINAVQGFLPAFGLTQRQLQITAAVLAVSCICIKGGEMFFNRVASLFKNGEAQVPPVPQSLDTALLRKTETETKAGI